MTCIACVVIDIGSGNASTELLDIMLMAPEVRLVCSDEVDQKFTWEHAILVAEHASSLKEDGDIRIQPEPAQLAGVHNGLRHLKQSGWQLLGR